MKVERKLLEEKCECSNFAMNSRPGGWSGVLQEFGRDDCEFFQGQTASGIFGVTKTQRILKYWISNFTREINRITDIISFKASEFFYFLETKKLLNSDKVIICFAMVLFKFFWNPEIVIWGIFHLLVIYIYIFSSLILAYLYTDSCLLQIYIKLINKSY